MATFSFGGLATGLDTGAIIQQLVLLESKPLARLEQRRSSITSAQSQFNTFKSKLQALADKAEDLKDSDKLSLFSTTSTDEDVLTVSASGSAAAGSHQLVVNTLAEARTGITDAAHAFSDTDTTQHGSGTIDITVDGETTQVTITSGTNDTLQGIRDAINDADAGVQASIINDGSGYRILIASEETGTQNAFSITSTLSFLDEGAASNPFAELNAAVNADFDIDGLNITSQSNDVEDVLQGVTFQLHDTGSANVTISRDVSAIGDELQEFVDAYNDVMSYIDAQDSSDTFSRSIKTTLQSVFNTALDDNDFDYWGLSQVGIETDASGRATLDRSNLEDAIDEDFSAFIDIFVGTNAGEKGFGELFEDAFEGVNGNPGILTGGDGLLQARQDSLASRLRSIDGQIEGQERRLDKLEESLTRRFASYEGLTATFQSQGAFLQAALLGLG